MKSLPVRCLFVLCLLWIILPCAACAAGPRASAEDIATALKPYLRSSLQYDFPSLKAKYPLNIYYLEPTTGSESRDVIVYIKNRAWERIGQEDDLSILKDFIQQKFIVLTLDFGDEPRAVTPLIDNDINTVHRAVFGANKVPNILKDISLRPNVARCFIVPEGYRVATNLTYWEIDKHGVHGTLEYIMKTYNEEIVPKIKQKIPDAPALKPATKPSDMVDRYGKPFDYRIKMDIVYPSKPTRKLPTFVYSETQATRNSHHRYLFQLRGYTYVIMGHCFNPCVQHYWHWIRFTLDHWNGLACYTAGMRYIYKNADQYSIDTNHIGMMGISKGQYAVTRLSDPNHARSEESKKYSEFPEGFGKFPDGTPQPQPWQGYPSRIHAGWQGMGMGLWESEYITPDYVPTILACGDHDNDNVVKQGTPAFLKALEKLDVNHVYLPMDDLGHSISIGYDKRLGVDRYQLVYDFFDRYLQVDAKLPPVVLIATPRDGAEKVDPASTIWVQFAPVIDEKNILAGKAVKVVNLSDNQEIQGAWKVSHGGTKFTFTPAQPLAKGGQYEVSVTKGVKDKAGTALQAEKKVRFKIAD